MTFHLGMDGGGTKTAFVLLDGDGAVVAEDRQPSCYYFGTDTGIDLVEQVLAAGVGNVVEAAGIRVEDITFAFLAIPGYGEASGDVAHLDAMPARVLGHDRYLCGNDMLSGWAGSLGGLDGINVVAGTGSVAYGERGERTHRVGGWSELFGDEGSAYWVAVQGLNAFSRTADGREPRTALHGAFREALQVTDDLDVIGVVVDRWQGSRSRIAGLARVVTATAASGDARALGIVRAAAAELADLVTTTAIALGHTDELVPVSWSGGLFNAPVVQAEFEQALQRSAFRVELVKPRHGPELGSALYAVRAARLRGVVA